MEALEQIALQMPAIDRFPDHFFLLIVPHRIVQYLLVGAPYAAARGISVEAVGAMILGIVGMNGVPEALVSGIIVVPIVMTLKKSGWKLK